jgi:DNA-binding NtrC family response regulator
VIFNNYRWIEVLHIAKRIRELDRLIPLIMITENSSEEHIITALRAGINDYFKYPFKKEELLQSIERCLSNNDTKKSLSFYKKMPQKSGSTQNLIGASRAMQSVSMLADHASVTDCNVLITGETGTGKELVANLIHRNSSRGNNPFVCINCHTGPSVGK